MKPSQIPVVLDLAWQARLKGEIFNPLFTGEAGLGKSAICQQWVKKQKERNPDFFFLDLRIAYMEAPDMIGFPEKVMATANGKEILTTIHAIPEIWPMEDDTEGLILLEEPNRGTTGVMNCLMQVLTDRKIHLHNLPEKVIIAGCVNPDSAEYDVNAMDAALRDRFEDFEVEYDHLSFHEFMVNKSWDSDVIRFFGESGIWVYKTSDQIGEGQRYISPRTISKINAAMRANLKGDRQLHRIVSTSILGKEIGNEFNKFCYDQAPVTAQDILKDKKKALDRLKKQCDPNDYKGDMVAMTVDSIVKEYGGLKATEDQIDEPTMAEVAKIIPKDQAINLIKGCGFKDSKTNISTFFKDFVGRNKDLVDVLRASITINRGTN
jgi:hypothetical protein